MKYRLKWSLITYFGMWLLLIGSYSLHKYVLHTPYVTEFDEILRGYLGVSPFVVSFTNISVFALALTFIFLLYFLVVGSLFRVKGES